MGSRSRYWRGLGAALGDCDPTVQSCNPAGVPVYGIDGGYQSLPNSAPIGSGGSYALNTQNINANNYASPPIGTGGSSPSSAGYTPNIDYGPGGVIGGSAPPPTLSTGIISTVVEGTSGLSSVLQGTVLGIPTWLALLLGAGVAYKFYRGRK